MGVAMLLIQVKKMKSKSDIEIIKYFAPVLIAVIKIPSMAKPEFPYTEKRIENMHKILNKIFDSNRCPITNKICSCSNEQSCKILI